MKLGVFTVSTPDYSPEECLTNLKNMGYDGIEWRVTEDDGDQSQPSFWSGNRSSMTAKELIEKAPALIKLAKDVGMEMPSLGAYLDCDNMENVKIHFEAAQSIGAKNIRISPGLFDPEKNYNEQIDIVKEQYSNIAELAKSYSVRAVIETHMRQLAPSISKAMTILSDLDPKYVGIMWDPGNQVVEGVEVYPMAMDIAGPYLAEVHAKNLRWEAGETENGRVKWSGVSCPLREGIVDWPNLIQLLKERQYDGWIFFEDFSTEQPLGTRLKDNLAWFRELIAQ